MMPCNISISSTLLAFVISATSYGQNLISNPTFHEGLKDWRTVLVRGKGSAAVDAAVRRNNLNSCRLISDPKSRLSLTKEIPVEANTVYRLTFWYRTLGDNDPNPEASATANNLAEPQTDTGDTTLRAVMKPPKGSRSNVGDFLCYIGNEPFAPTFGCWKQVSLYLRTHPLAATCVLEFNVTGRTLWLNSFSMEPGQPGPNETILSFDNLPANPLYQELLTDRPRNITAYPNWSYNFKKSYSDYALKFAHEFLYGDQYAEAAQHRFASFAFGGAPQSNHFPLTELGYVRSGAVINASRSGRGSPAPFLHPVTEKLMLESVDRFFTNGKTPWGLFYSDEPFYSAAPPADRREEEDRQFWEKVDAEVRENYGKGKYGIPTEDSQPYHWIAYRRWSDDKLFQLFSRVQERARSHSPDVILVGPNELSTAIPRDWEKLGATWDISSGQTLPAWNAIYKQITGYLTKLYSDLTFKPVYPFVQVSAYDQASTPEFTREQYSQVLRNGGTGFWVNGVEWYDSELNHPKFNSPDRWKSMLELMDTVRATPELRFPKPDCAILFSVDTEQAKPRVHQGDMECGAAYLYLGPVVGSWFNFISERQIETGSRNLGDYKVIYLPNARYLRGSVVEKLETYVRNGGILVSGDPEALTTDDFGEDTTDIRARLFGVRVGGELKNMRLTARQVMGGPALPAKAEYPIYGSPRELKLESRNNTAVPLAFENGLPGLVMQTLGKGKTLFFAYNPFNVKCATQQEWKDLFRTVQQWAGCSVDEPIWRFTLPMKAAPAAIPKEGELKCLTGNHVQMVSSVAFTADNIKAGGGYLYRVAPTQEGKSGEFIPFEKGKLTDRARAYATSVRGRQTPKPGYVAHAADDWSIDWTNPNEALEIEFTLTADYHLNRLSFLASGDIPAFTVYAGSEIIFEHGTISTLESDVKKIDVPLKGTHRELTLKFHKSPNAFFRLAEVEIWGAK